MNWFEGSLKEAIDIAKQNNLIFAIYIEGNDKLSEVMSSVINSHEISSVLESKEFISFRIKSDSENYRCFVQIYKHVQVPSLFLIGLNGFPVAIIHYASNENSSNLHQNIVRIILQEKKLFQRKFLGRSATTSDEVNCDYHEIMDNTKNIDGNETVTPPINLDGHDYTINRDNEAAGSTSEGAVVQNFPSESMEILDKDTEIIDELHLKQNFITDNNDQENKEEEKIIVNNSVAIKRKQIDDENDRIVQESKREKVQYELDRQRILKEIAQDKEERLARQRDRNIIHKTNLNTQQTGSKSNTVMTRANSQDETCIQFRKPDGVTVTKVFNVNNVMNDLRNYVVCNILLDSRHFDLAVPFPRHVFTPDENDKTLEELQLVPNAVLLILPITSNSGFVSKTFGRVSNGVWYFLSPIGFFFQQIGSSTVRRVQDSAGYLFRMALLSPALPQSNRNFVNDNGRQSSTYQNVHTVNDNRNYDDSDDKDSVWNGNSTLHSRKDNENS